ncbi:unnamed protein product [Cladocopium goreaui]|uniref:Sepiapterin reductase n=1 Tax=Cladocopium goreaui TaxID=2562237 RepID=A0A9P1CB39_9DINO|nr:unnamed protein product [Cladocopium goreaui]
MWKHGRLAAVVLASVVAAEDFLCRCDWKDNYWLHIAEDLGHIFASPTDFFEAPTSDANRSRRWQGQWQLLQLAVTDGLCRLDPSRTVPLDAGRLRFNPSWVQLDEKGQPRNVLPEIFFGELCVPGMIATNLLCALHFTFTFQEGRPVRSLLTFFVDDNGLGRLLDGKPSFNALPAGLTKHTRNVLPQIFFGELSVPGMIATNLLCALHFTFTFQDGRLLDGKPSFNALPAGRLLDGKPSFNALPAGLTKHTRNVLPEIFFGELCVPGMIATNLLCALHFTFTFQEPNFFLAGRHARRLQQLLPWVQSCWAAPWAALHLEDLENFAERWAQRTALKPVTSLLFQGVSHPIPAASLSPALRRCWPVRSSGCWPKLSRVDKASCSMCCDPRFTRGDPTCFLGEWTFERCCQSEDPAGWPPGPKPVEVEAIPDELLEELRRELSTATTSTALPSSFSTERRVRLHPAGSARCFLADLGKPAELQSLLEPVLQYLTENSDLLCAKFSKAEVLVLHNAGSLGRLAYTQQLAADSAAALDLNVTSFVLLTQMLLQRFSKQVKLPKSNVRIVFVNISSLLALQVMPSWSLYATGKAARDMYMLAVAADVQKCAMDVRTLSWAPGPMDTQMMKEILTTCPDDEVLKQFQEMEKQDRLVKLVDSAEKLMKLLKEDSFQNAAHIDFFDV